MPDVVIRVAEGCDGDNNALWDSVWNPLLGVADWALAGAAPGNAGGLRASATLETCVILALFTDKRVDPDHPLAFLADGEVRGYFGDGVDVRDDLGEGPLGSHLWLLERAPLTIRGQSAARWAEQFTYEALACLLDQGIVVRIEAEATANEIQNRLELVVRLYGRDGAKVYDRKFDVLWNQGAR